MTNPKTASEQLSGVARQGFASMDPARQKQIASMGGKASHRSGNAHEFTSEEARIAGSKSRSRKALSPEALTRVKALEAAAKTERKKLPTDLVVDAILNGKSV